MKRLHYLLFLIILAVTSCSHPKDLVYRNVQNFSMQKAALSMDVRLYNPNKYKLKLKNADLDVYLNGSHLGKVLTDKKCAVTRLDTFTLPIRLAVDFGTALPNLMQLIFSNEIDVRLTGKVKAGRHGVYVTVPIDYNGKQDIRSGIKL